MNEEKKAIVREVIGYFPFEGVLTEAVVFGSGHINDTYRLTFEKEGWRKRYILQRMNKDIFKQPKELMENIVGVTSWLKKKIIENGGNPERETLNVLKTNKGENYCIDKSGEYWRVYLFIEEATSYDQVETDEDFYQSAVAFGNFQRLLADYPADTLHETIPDFHNTAVRYQNFERAVEADCVGRRKSVEEEITFVRGNREFSEVLGKAQKAGELPLRVTHNDTKLNNIMIDDETHTGICVIDLDTVMPGLSVNDFGDAIRFGASTGAEDEQDLTKVSCDLYLFELYAKGFIKGCDRKLTAKELEMLPIGAIVMTYECGIRFLTDYLEGDHYFRIHRENHNLDRCRTQFKLVADMKEKLPQMREIISNLTKQN